MLTVGTWPLSILVVNGQVLSFMSQFGHLWTNLVVYEPVGHFMTFLTRRSRSVDLRSKSQLSWLLTNFDWNEHRCWVSLRDRIFSENHMLKLRCLYSGHKVNINDFRPEVAENDDLGSNCQFTILDRKSPTWPTIFNSFSLKMLSWVILGNTWSTSSKLTIWAQNNMFGDFWPKVAKIDFVSRIKASRFGHLFLAKDAITRWHSPAMVISGEIGQKSRPLTFGSKMPFSAVFGQLVMNMNQLGHFTTFLVKSSRDVDFRSTSQSSWLLTNFDWNDDGWWLSLRDRIFSENHMSKLSTMSLFWTQKSIFTTFGLKWPKMMFWAQTASLRFWS